MPATEARFLAAAAALTLLAQPHAHFAPRLWVLQPPDAIVAYDTATFEPRRTVTVPRRACAHPDDLRVSVGGRIMLVPPAVAVTDDDGSAVGRIWIWDGSRARELPLGDRRVQEIPPNATTATETRRTPFFAASEDALIWFENRFEKNVESGLERSVRLSARIWQTDLRGERPRPIASLPATGPCECGTGVCEETCPEWGLWAPDGLVGDFFLLTSGVPGQLGSTTLDTRLYLRSGAAWNPRTLPQPIEQPLAASPTATMLVAAVPDGGCCGWENEGNDQLLLWRDGKQTVVYDERLRYDNADYDVSFYPADARLSPGLGALAFTLASTARPGAEIRLTVDGKPNDAELARVRKAIAELPAVDVEFFHGTAAKRATIPRAELVGWLDDERLLVARDGRLIVCRIDGTLLRQTGIRVRTAADAFLR